MGQDSRTCLGIFCIVPEAKGSIALEKGVTLAPLWILHQLGEHRPDRRAVLVRVEVLPVCLLIVMPDVGTRLHAGDVPGSVVSPEWGRG